MVSCSPQPEEEALFPELQQKLATDQEWKRSVHFELGNILVEVLVLRDVKM